MQLMVTSESGGAAVSLRGLTKSYGPRLVLKRIDFELRAGEFVAVVGRSGCGKSTLLRLLAHLDLPDSGTVSLGGTKPDHARAITRLMFQDALLLPWKTVLGNVALGLKLPRDKARERSLEALHHVGLVDRAADWPSRLSGGQRQRVALARALVHRPRLLLLDEPLGALDALTRIEMQALIERVWREERFTALLVTHDVAEAVALADRVLLIEDGTLCLDLPVELPRPRERTSAPFAALEDEVLRRVMKLPPPNVKTGMPAAGLQRVA